MAVIQYQCGKCDEMYPVSVDANMRPARNLYGPCPHCGQVEAVPWREDTSPLLPPDLQLGPVPFEDMSGRVLRSVVRRQAIVTQPRDDRGKWVPEDGDRRISTLTLQSGVGRRLRALADAQDALAATMDEAAKRGTDERGSVPIAERCAGAADAFRTCANQLRAMAAQEDAR